MRCAYYTVIISFQQDVYSLRIVPHLPLSVPGGTVTGGAPGEGGDRHGKAKASITLCLCTVYQILKLLEVIIMARSTASRKYQLTINNPSDHGYSHETIKKILNDYSSIEYWCLCDEIGIEGTQHTHVYAVFANAVMFTTIQKRFYGAHIEPARGTNIENRDYIRKEGKWLEDEKRGTNLSHTFEESGELPQDRETLKKETEDIFEMVNDGASDFEILQKHPNAMRMIDKVGRARLIVLEDRNKKEFRQMNVSYLYGKTGVGKTRSIMEKYGYENCYRVTNYKNPFDSYAGQPIIIFEEFRSSLPISEMLIYLDGYPTILPSRHYDRYACFDTVFIITNIPLEEQYPNIQRDEPETWNAFKRRIKDVICMLPRGSNVLAWTDDPDEEDKRC